MPTRRIFVSTGYQLILPPGKPNSTNLKPIYGAIRIRPTKEETAFATPESLVCLKTSGRMASPKLVMHSRFETSLHVVQSGTFRYPVQKQYMPKHLPANSC